MAKQKQLDDKMLHYDKFVTNSHLYNIIADPDADEYEVGDVAGSESTILRIAAARHPSANADTLRRLSVDKSTAVRCFVASNPNTPFLVLKKLSVDRSNLVLSRLAMNKNIDEEIRTNISKVAAVAHMLNCGGSEKNV